MSDTPQHPVEEQPAPPAEPARRGLETFPYTDSGNAERLVSVAGGDHLYVEGIGWHGWDGKRFGPDESSVMRTAKRTIRLAHRLGEVMAFGDDMTDARREVGDDLMRWARQSESAPRLRAMVALAENELDVRASADDLDADPWLLNVANGTLDLCSGELRPASRDDRITKLSNVVYKEGATDPVWSKTLAGICQGYDGLEEWLQLGAGYGVTGSTREDLIFLFDGPGGTCKTTFCDSIRSVAGEYGHTAPFDMFTQRRGDARHAAEIAALVGRRLVTIEEGPKGKKFDTARLKELDGSKPVAAQYMRQNWFNFQPIAKLWFVSNYRPHVHAEDTGAWRRLVANPFTNAIPIGQQDAGVRGHLQTSPDAQSAILAWVVAGAAQYWDATKDGRKLMTLAPECVLARTGEWRRDSDRVGAWIEDRCELGEGWTSSTALQESINRWWNTFVSEEYAPPSLMAGLGDDLRAKGCHSRKDENGVRGWAGIRLRPPLSGWSAS